MIFAIVGVLCSEKEQSYIINLGICLQSMYRMHYEVNVCKKREGRREKKHQKT